MQGWLGEGKESSKGRRSRMPQCFFLSHVPPHSPTHSYHQEENESDLETQSHAEEAPCPTRFLVDTLTVNRAPDHRPKLCFWSQLWHLLVMWLWISVLTSQSLCFTFFKMRTVTPISASSIELGESDENMGIEAIYNQSCWYRLCLLLIISSKWHFIWSLE